MCSHPTCRNGGIKFAYCKYCDAPVAKRSLRQHDHEDLRAAEEETSTNVLKKNHRHQGFSDEDDRKLPAKKRQKVTIAESDGSSTHSLDALAEAAAVAAPRRVQGNGGAVAPDSQGGFKMFQITSGSSETSSFSASSGTRPCEEGEPNDSSSTSDEQNEAEPSLDAAPVDAAAVLDHNNGGNDRDQLRGEWLSLLEARRSIQSADEMSSWLARVFAISDRCTRSDNHNISDDDENNSSHNDNNCNSDSNDA